jgi:uncharacterized protein (DUF4415 family)
MTNKTKKKFEEGHGFSQEDWDAVNSPELTDEELANMRPATEVLPPEFFDAIDEMRRARGRPPVEKPKKLVTLRLDQDVIEKFQKTGKQWRAKMNEALKRARI